MTATGTTTFRRRLPYQRSATSSPRDRDTPPVPPRTTDIDPRELPVYREKDRILDALRDNRVLVVESPTGSGKTTQLPIILHEAGYTRNGMIGHTQPRRIAAVSVSEFIAAQLGETVPGLVGYKMRFYDVTTRETRVKIMTDGILLQEIKTDQNLSDYSVIIVDEAHERSLNIDFVLGLLKRALAAREDLRVIVSSATINAEVFSQYFDGCPVIRIDAAMYPVQVIYDDPARGSAALETGERVSERERREIAQDALIARVTGIIGRRMEAGEEGDILVFLPGEQLIKDTMMRLYSEPYRARLHILPLYGRLSKEEQDRVFLPTPEGTIKIVLATNIAETSITIDGITAVIDSGLAKTNYYNPRTYTSALVEGPISRAAAAQRKGRAGRTRPGTCYRLYSSASFDNRPLFEQEEIYRTDLSEVVLRMAEIGIRDFEQFDFLSSPGRGNIRGAVETLRLLDALDQERSLTDIGRTMAIFPLLPRHSRIIVEAIRRYPEVLQEVLVAVSFLTSQTPFVLPPGEEMEARRAHHRYRDELGDFVSYLRLFSAYTDAPEKKRFCDSRYLDPRMMAEIANVYTQLSEIVSNMGIPILAGGPRADYLAAIARGLIQFVCIHTKKGVYQSLTAERIQIHPGSGMFRETPQFIVAGEIVKTSRTYARSVSPLHREWLQSISEELYRSLRRERGSDRDDEGGRDRGGRTRDGRSGRDGAPGGRDRWQIRIGGQVFPLLPYKGKKKIAVLAWNDLAPLFRQGRPPIPPNAANVRARVEVGGYTVLNGERLSSVLRIGEYLSRNPTPLDAWPKKQTYEIPAQLPELIATLPLVLRMAPIKGSGTRYLGFLALYTSADGHYWLKPNKGFYNAVHESLASLEQLADDLADRTGSSFATAVSELYRTLAEIIERD